jgi:gamma-glutamyltranspeptidase/glutathione hydrolase/leukotriene-C4 hydrolase
MFILASKNDEKDTDNSKRHSNIFHKHAISSEVPIASDTGLKILQMGGNAVDAAIATCICVGIVNSFSSGLGGGGFMLIKKMGDENSSTMIDFREKAPGKLDVTKLSQDTILSKVGGLAVGIPGEIKGLYHAHSKYGHLKWKEIISECIEVANHFEVTEELHKRLKKFETLVRDDEGLSEVYIKDGEVVGAGEFIGRHNLARTLEVLAEDPGEFYSGKIANCLIRSINNKGGSVSSDDFEGYEIKEHDTVKGRYGDFSVYTTGLPSSGILVLLALNILDKFDLKELIKNESEHTHLHVLVEIFKFVMAKRGNLGDPEFNKNIQEILDELSSDNLASAIYKKINFDTTLPIENYEVEDYNKIDAGTTHINVVDKDGLVVSLTSTINLEFGAKFMDPVTGIILNNQIDDFYIPNVPNSYNINQTIRNIVSPNKVPLSSAAPIILENERELLVLGAAGGIRIPTSIIEVIFFMSLGYSLKDSINQPRMHHQLDPDVVYIEEKESPEVVESLKSRNHNVQKSKTNTAFTSVQGILVQLKDDGEKYIDAVSDYRKNGKSAGE